LFFDVGDTDCPIHRLGFMALGYIQFGFSALAMIAAVFRLITIKIQHEAGSKKTQRATHILISMIVAAAFSAVYGALFVFGDMFIYNSIASLVIYCGFWLALGADLYFRKVNLYKLFVATSMGEDKKKLRNSKKIFVVEIITCILFPSTQMAFSIAIYVVNDLQIQIGLTRGAAAAMLVSFVVNAAVPLTYASQVSKRLSEHLKSGTIENVKAIKVGLRKVKMIITAIFTVLILPLIPNVLIMAMPIVHAYIFQIYLTLYLITVIQAAILVLQPSKIRKGPKSSNSTQEGSKQSAPLK
jgi:hypothetical protein